MFLRRMFLKKIKIIEMGGTISAKGIDRLDRQDYESGHYNGEHFLNDLPEIEKNAKIDFFHFSNVSSTELDQTHWLKLRSLIVYFLKQQNYDGIVITHGTSTLEETAYFLHLTLPTSKPVVLVGAQRPYTALSSDAGLNLINAVKVASDEKSHDLGVLVVLNNEISCAREVSKTHTYQVQTFSSDFGFLGTVEPDNTIQYYRKPMRLHTQHSDFSNISMTKLPEIAIVYSYAGAKGDIINSLIESEKYKGIVIAGTGAGLMSPLEKEALIKAQQAGCFVVRSSHVGHGRVTETINYQNHKFIAGDNLSPQKARILLMVSLLKFEEVSDIQNVFYSH